MQCKRARYTANNIYSNANTNREKKLAPLSANDVEVQKETSKVENRLNIADTTTYRVIVPEHDFEVDGSKRNKDSMRLRE